MKIVRQVLAIFLLRICQLRAQEKVSCETTAGNFTIDLHRQWAPLGHDRFVELVESQFFSDQIIYRTIPGFLVQFGVAADPAVQQKWTSQRINDDAQQNIAFTQGTVSFAGNGANSRSCHIFISLDPNGRSLGNALHERPFGRITDPNHQLVAEKFYSGYGDLTHLQGAVSDLGNTALKGYPRLDRLKRCYLGELAEIKEARERESKRAKVLDEIADVVDENGNLVEVSLDDEDEDAYRKKERQRKKRKQGRKSGNRSGKGSSEL